MVALLNHGQMIGMYTRIFILNISFLTLLACSKKQVEYHSLKSQFSREYNLNLGSREQSVYFSNIAKMNIEPIKRKDLSYYLDLDGDGIVDIHDEDIDDDGFHNYIDSHPMDSELGGEDTNLDGIVDFIAHPNFIHLQLSLKQYGINLIILNEKTFNSKVQRIFTNKKFIGLLKGLNTISFTSVDLDKSADYNKEWKSINIYPLALEYAPSESLIHEGFHHYAHIEQEFYAEVISRLGWQESIDEYGISNYELDKNTDLPSDYAYINPEEAFAEVMTYYFTQAQNINVSRFDYAQEFKVFSNRVDLDSFIFEQLF